MITEKRKSDQVRRVAVVTGAAKRIGASIARQLHEKDFDVLVHYRSSDTAATQLITELNGTRTDSAFSIKADLQKGDSVSKIINAAMDNFGRVDLLVNNASVFYPTPLGNITANDFGNLFATNVQAPLLLAQAAYPHLTECEGSIVNIIDIYSQLTHKEHSVYSASKAALSNLTKSLATEFAPAVRVNGVSPGAILWPEGEASLSEDKKQEVLCKIPLSRMGSAEDIAKAVLYLAEAQFVTGHIINVDGGRCL